jgi:hypothetical protein
MVCIRYVDIFMISLSAHFLPLSFLPSMVVAYLKVLRWHSSRKAEEKLSHNSWYTKTRYLWNANEYAFRTTKLQGLIWSLPGLFFGDRYSNCQTSCKLYSIVPWPHWIRHGQVKIRGAASSPLRCLPCADSSQDVWWLLYSYVSLQLFSIPSIIHK